MKLTHARRFSDITDKLNLVKFDYSGLVLGSSQFSLLPEKG